MDCHYGYQQCPGRDRLRPFGAVFCHGRVPVGGVLPGDPAAGICPAAFHPLCRSQGRCGLFSGNHAGNLPHLRRRRFQCHVRHGRAVSTAATLPTEIVSAIEDVGFLASIPPLAGVDAGQPDRHRSVLYSDTHSIRTLFPALHVYSPGPGPTGTPLPERERRQAEKAFLKSYIGVCMEGAVVVLACLIYSPGWSEAPAVLRGRCLGYRKRNRVPIWGRIPAQKKDGLAPAFPLRVVSAFLFIVIVLILRWGIQRFGRCQQGMGVIPLLLSPADESERPVDNGV